MIIDKFSFSGSLASPVTHFGAAVDVYGDTAVVGQPEPTNVAYVFVRHGTTWLEQDTLTAGDLGNAGFGYSVSIYKDTVVVGHPADSAQGLSAGSAYVFVRDGNNWELQQKLLPNDGKTKDRFGHSVAISEDVIILGAPAHQHPTDPGAAYVFRRVGDVWQQEQKLIGGNISDDALFGLSVEIDGTTVIVGAVADDQGGVTDSGAAYVFVHDGTTWIEEDKLAATSPTTADLFGRSVAVSENTVIVGTPQDDDMGTNAGSVYVFNRNGSLWTLHQKLIASDGVAGNRFGESVAINGDTAIIAAVDLLDLGTGRVSDVYAYIFHRNEAGDWIEDEKLTFGLGWSVFTEGAFVSVHECTAIVGTELSDSFGGTDAGAAHALLMDTCPCREAPRDMVSWWALDELGGPTAVDSIGDNDGAWVNTPLAMPGMVDGALAFRIDGVEVADHPSLNFGTDRSFTIDVWVKPAALLSSAALVDKTDPVTGAGYSLKLVNGRVAVFVTDGTISSPSFVSTEIVPDEHWSHIAVTVDRGSDSGVVYINGEADGTFVPSVTAPGSIDNTNSLFIAMNVPGEFYAGLIDEVEIFERALNRSEVRLIYGALSGGKCKPCVDVPAGLVAWWPFDELSGFSSDIAGANHGNLINDPNPVPGKVDEALDFDGQDQFVEVPDHSSLNFGAGESFSIDLWIKPTKLENLVNPLVEKWDPTTHTGYRLFIRDGILAFTMNDGSSAVFSHVWPNKIDRGVWTFIAVTVDRNSGEGCIYINNEDPQAFVPISGDIGNQQPLLIGRSILGGFYNGVMDEVEIYNRSLNVDEVNAIRIADDKGKCKS